MNRFVENLYRKYYTAWATGDNKHIVERAKMIVEMERILIEAI